MFEIAKICVIPAVIGLLAGLTVNVAEGVRIFLRDRREERERTAREERAKFRSRGVRNVRVSVALRYPEDGPAGKPFLEADTDLYTAGTLLSYYCDGFFIAKKPDPA